MQERATPSVVDSEQALLLVDPDTLAIVHASRGAERALGFGPGQRGDASLRDVVVHPPAAELERLVGVCFRDGVAATIDALIDVAGERTLPVALALTPLQSSERGLLAIMLRSAGGGAQPTEATHLDADDAAFSDFAGRLGHDLNNLLSTILGSLGLLREDDASMSAGERRQLVDDALSASRECADFLDRLLTAAGKKPRRASRMDVNEVIARIAPLLRSTLPAHIEFEESLETGLPEVLLDPDRLEAAIICLAINAREAMVAGGRLAIASELERDSNPARVRISVSDEGCGIAEDVRARVLEPLFTTKVGGTGRGLGLNIVARFVRQANGTMEIESAEDQGTRITLSFPKADPSPE